MESCKINAHIQMLQGCWALKLVERIESANFSSDYKQSREEICLEWDVLVLLFFIVVVVVFDFSQK